MVKSCRIELKSVAAPCFTTVMGINLYCARAWVCSLNVSAPVQEERPEPLTRKFQESRKERIRSMHTQPHAQHLCMERGTFAARFIWRHTADSLCTKDHNAVDYFIKHREYYCCNNILLLQGATNSAPLLGSV